jgi:thymidylate synthase
MKLNEPIENYFSVMDAFQGKRQLRKQHDDTRYWANSQNQFIVYPKNKELKEVLSQWQMPDVELTRAEMKLLNADVISKKFGNNLMGELIGDDEIYSDVFNEYVRDVIFKEKQYKTQQIDFGEYYQVYEDLYRVYKNRAFDIFLKSFGILELVKQEKGIENIEKIIRKLHSERTARRRIAEINDLVRIYKDSFETITPEFVRRNNELREKIFIPQTKAA